MLAVQRFLCLLLCLVAFPAFAEKTDIVVLTNGDRITGEIKKLEAGLLQYSTDTMGTVQIEWRFIQQIITNEQQVIETVDGTRWVGKIQKPEGSEDVAVITVRGPIALDPQEVVAAWPVRATFLDKLDLSLSLGFDYAKSTGISNFTLAGDLLYRTEERVLDGLFRSNVTRQDSGDEQNRQELRLGLQHLLPKQRFRSLLAGYESNEAIGLDRRLYAGGAYGWYLRKTNSLWFTTAVGLIATGEEDLDGGTTESLEGLLGARFRYFRYAAPERVLDTSFSVFPSLTESGRWRGDLRTTFKLELIRDLFWRMEFYATYDSEPLQDAAQNYDYGVNTGVGWSF